jgi:hypothetical protein
VIRTPVRGRSLIADAGSLLTNWEYFPRSANAVFMEIKRQNRIRAFNRTDDHQRARANAEAEICGANAGEILDKCAAELNNRV